MMPSTGSGATAQVFELVVNNGSHSLKITSIPTDSIVGNVGWSTYRTTISHSDLGASEPIEGFARPQPARCSR
jgi:hypothetical protein